jgi:hypothetical protein
MHEEVNVALVSCSQKHTLVLDVLNRLWYFGSKESVGVGSDDKICQFEPIRLGSVGSFEDGG